MNFTLQRNMIFDDFLDLFRYQFWHWFLMRFGIDFGSLLGAFCNYFHVFRHRFLHRFVVDFLVEKLIQNESKSVWGMLSFWHPKSTLAPKQVFGNLLVAFCFPFGCLFACFGSLWVPFRFLLPPFGTLWFSLGSLLAPFLQPFRNNGSSWCNFRSILHFTNFSNVKFLQTSCFLGTRRRNAPTIDLFSFVDDVWKHFRKKMLERFPHASQIIVGTPYWSSYAHTLSHGPLLFSWFDVWYCA